MPASRNTRIYTRTRAPAAVPPSPTSSQTDLASSPPCSPRKRPFSGLSSINDSPSAKRRKTGVALAAKSPSAKSTTNRTPSKPLKKQRTLTQLHLLPDQSVMRECKECGLSYTHAATEDERIHKAHCIRVRKGMEWGREDERSLGSGELAEVAKNVKLKNGKIGRVISFRGDISGKVGRKVCHCITWCWLRADSGFSYQHYWKPLISLCPPHLSPLPHSIRQRPTSSFSLRPFPPENLSLVSS
jgi:hypothetical protein